MRLKEKRDKFISLTKQQLMGTQLKDNLLVGEKPLNRFFTGFLFPIMSIEDNASLEHESEDDYSLENTDNSNTEKVKSIKKDKRYIPPSSAGFSFFGSF